MASIDINGPTIGHIDLKVEEVAARYAIPRSSLTLSKHDGDWMTNEVIYQLVRRVATVPGIEEVRVPATWQDGFKESEARRSPIMRWWVARHPVNYRTWRALEVLPNFPELDRYRSDIRIVRLIRNDFDD